MYAFITNNPAFDDVIGVVRYSEVTSLRHKGKKVQVGKDQEKAQSERDPTSKTEVEKKTN